MAPRTLKEVNMPYTVNPEDEAIGRETVIIHRNGEPIAVMLPYAEYTKLLARPPIQLPENSLDFERERAAFQRLLPELLKAHRGEWAAIVNEQAVEFGLDFNSVIVRVRQRFGQRPVYVHEVLEQHRVYKIESPRIVRR